jgi:hypothetical protein
MVVDSQIMADVESAIGKWLRGTERRHFELKGFECLRILNAKLVLEDRGAVVAIGVLPFEGIIRLEAGHFCER